MTASESHHYSAVSQLKSPTRMDSLNIFESSPIVKRVKISEEEEKEGLQGENLNLGENSIEGQSLVPSIRKSKRKKRKSKIMREATGEESEEVTQKVNKRHIITKTDYETNKIIELSKISKNKEELIPSAKSHNYLVEFDYGFG